MRSVHHLLIGGLLGLFPITTLAAPPEYTRDIAPLFARSCISCHGETHQRGGFRLDSLAATLEGGNSGPGVIAGKSATSPIVEAMLGTNDRAIMPPKGTKLTPSEIASVRAWIDAGAKGDTTSTPTIVENKPVRSSHWAFQPIQPIVPPMVKSTKHVRNPIDAFILAKLEPLGIAPSPAADRITLIRRLSLDLRGLPPTIAEVDAFTSDTSPDAYEKLVDRMLASPHYGERQARHWLDAARYADSNGYTIDGPRAIWKYRDWVIDAFNRDMPFDQFTIEQLAGDLLPNPTNDQLIATGFHRNTQINQEGGIDLEQFRVESVIDRVNTTGTVWLGLTVGCAQCHDHKYDPISQREYYRLYAFFNQCDEPTLELLSPPEAKRKREITARLKAVQTKLKSLDKTTPALVEQWERRQTDATRERLSPEVRKVFEIAENGRTPEQKAFLENTFREMDQVRQGIGMLSAPTILPGVTHLRMLQMRVSLTQEQASLNQANPVALTSLIVRETKKPRESYVFLGGDFLRRGVSIQSGTPAVLPKLPERPSTNRLDLAKWLVDGRNPLTGRVLANRIWGQLFGIGIVETDNDFGTQGTPPTHPELLDWLAMELVRQGWSLKSIHRLIVMSATYRQQSTVRPELVSVDARNRLLARQSRHRVEAEIVRDVALTASGLLNRKIGGPSVFPPQPDGMYRFTQVNKNWLPSIGAERYRRGLYTHFWRSAPHPALTTFDAPDATATCTRRVRSNTPLQALTLLNDRGFVEYAHGLADRILREGGSTDRARLIFGYRQTVSRTPTEAELIRLERFVAEQSDDLTAHPDEVAAILSGGKPITIGSSASPAIKAAWVQVARVLLNLDETITRE